MDRLNLSALRLSLLEVSTGVNPNLKRRLSQTGPQTDRQIRQKDALSRAIRTLNELRRLEMYMERGETVYEDEVSKAKEMHNAAVRAVYAASRDANRSRDDRAALADARTMLDDARTIVGMVQSYATVRARPFDAGMREAHPVRPASPQREAHPEPPAPVPRAALSRDDAAERERKQLAADKALAIQIAAEDSRVRRQSQFMTPNDNFRGSARKSYDEQQPRAVAQGDLQ